MNCLWCDHPFEPGTRGKPKRFCSSLCRYEFQTAARQFTQALIDDGFLTGGALRVWNASRKTRTFYSAPISAVRVSNHRENDDHAPAGRCGPYRPRSVPTVLTLVGA